jgi:hypothetical protein
VPARSRAISGRLAASIALLTAFAASANAQQTGVITGIVRTTRGPVANARAILDAMREARTDSSGRFRLANVPVGKHSLEVLAIGTTPFKVDVIVPAGDTIDFEVLLERVVLLDSVRVEGSTVRQGFVRDYEDRKRAGMGRFLDSSQIKSFAVVPQAVSFVNGVRYRNGAIFFTTASGADCAPNVWIDKVNFDAEQGELKMMRPDDVMAIEVYTRSALIPDEFRPRRAGGCGALVVWTRRLWPQGKDR